MDKNNGGPAFPIYPKHNVGGWSELKEQLGMTLRDYMAIHATDEDIDAQRSVTIGLTRAQARYAHADSMLRAREST